MQFIVYNVAVGRDKKNKLEDQKMTNQKAIEKTEQEQIAWLDLQVEQASQYGKESVRSAESERAYYKSKMRHGEKITRHSK